MIDDQYSNFKAGNTAIYAGVYTKDGKRHFKIALPREVDRAEIIALINALHNADSWFASLIKAEAEGRNT